MRRFAEIPKTTQPTESAEASSVGRSHVGRGHDSIWILHVQRTIGNQAVERLLQSNTEQRNALVAGTASPYLGHDFARVPVRPLDAGAIQTKLAISAPGDEYEQEADRVADQVMRTPDPQIACACGEESPKKWQTENGAQGRQALQTKHAESGTLGLTEAPPSVLDVVRSPGRQIDPATRAFMEPRFGYDFSHVRVHSDAAAEQSARDMNARAYTVGQSIVFGYDQFAPGTHKGRRLLAHELVHTLQQSGGAPARVARQPMDPRHARGFSGEQGMGFIHYRQEDGWIFFEGPSGSAGHGVTESGFDGVAYNVRTSETHLVDNKSLARPGNVGSATAIDPSRNLDKNLDGLIQRVEAAKDVPGRVRLLGRLRALKASLAAGKPLPQGVKLVVTGVGGQSSGVTGRLQTEGIEFRPEPPPKSQSAATPPAKPPTAALAKPPAAATVPKPPPVVSAPSETAAPRPRTSAVPKAEPELTSRTRGRATLSGGKVSISSGGMWNVAGKVGTGASAALNVWGAISTIDSALAQLEKAQSGSVSPQVAAAIKAVEKSFPTADALRAAVLWYWRDRENDYSRATEWLHDNGVNAMMLKGAKLDRMGQELDAVLSYSRDYEKLCDELRRESDSIAPVLAELKKRTGVLYDIVHDLEKVIPYLPSDTAQVTIWGVRTEFWDAAQDLSRLESIVSTRKWTYDRDYADAQQKRRTAAAVFNFWAPAFAKIWKTQTGNTAAPTNLPVE